MLFSSTPPTYFPYIYFTMPELIHQILALPRSEKWYILSLLTEDLRKEEEDNTEVPSWQLEWAQKAREQIEKREVTALSHEQFWAAIDAKVDQLENQLGA